ncbi:hypothetical protein KM043_003420 [Ampulex compressa]|nr:hypothetical protein KM043_003420 [Ampulex compressa]
MTFLSRPGALELSSVLMGPPLTDYGKATFGPGSPMPLAALKSSRRCLSAPTPESSSRFMSLHQRPTSFPADRLKDLTKTNSSSCRTKLRGAPSIKQNLQQQLHYETQPGIKDFAKTNTSSYQTKPRATPSIEQNLQQQLACKTQSRTKATDRSDQNQQQLVPNKTSSGRAKNSEEKAAKTRDSRNCRRAYTKSAPFAQPEAVCGCQDDRRPALPGHPVHTRR